MLWALVRYVHVQALKDKVGVICKNVGPCVEVGVLGWGGAIVSKMEKGIFGAIMGVCDICPCIEQCRICVFG